MYVRKLFLLLKFIIFGNHFVIELVKQMANEGVCYRYMYLAPQCSIFHFINCILFTMGDMFPFLKQGTF